MDEYILFMEAKIGDIEDYPRGIRSEKATSFQLKKVTKLKKYTITLNLGTEIGSGAYGTVFEGTYCCRSRHKDRTYTSDEIVIKEVRLNNRKSLENFLTEVNIMNAVDKKESVSPKFHQAIIVQDTRKPNKKVGYIVMEKFDDSLSKLLQPKDTSIFGHFKFIKHAEEKNGIQNFTDTEVEKKLDKLYETLSRIGYICLDVKAGNTVIKYKKDKVSDVKLIDWGGDYCKSKGSQEDAHTFMKFLFAIHALSIYKYKFTFNGTLKNDLQNLNLINIPEPTLRKAVSNIIHYGQNLLKRILKDKKEYLNLINTFHKSSNKGEIIKRMNVVELIYFTEYVIQVFLEELS